MKSYKRHRDYGFWYHDIRLSKLSQLGDPLERLNKGVAFEMFRLFLEDKLSKEPSGKGGRPPYDYVLMFKILILQRAVVKCCVVFLKVLYDDRGTFYHFSLCVPYNMCEYHIYSKIFYNALFNYSPSKILQSVRRSVRISDQ